MVNDFHQVSAPRARACTGHIVRQDPSQKIKPALTSSPVHHVGGTLIRAKEQELWLAVQVNDGLLDSGGLTRNEQVDDGIDVFFEASSWFSAEPADQGQLREDSRVVEVTYEGKMVPLAPPSGISLFLSDCVEAKP